MNFKQNIEKNRLKIKELLERKIGKKKSKIGSSLSTTITSKYNKGRAKLVISLDFCAIN